MKNIYYSSHIAGEDATLIPVKRQFMQPIKARVRKSDGTEVLIGYGIGEVIEFWEPAVRCLGMGGCCGRVLNNGIPLTDGSVILEWLDGDLELRYVPKFMNETQSYLFECLYANKGRETVANLHRKFMEKGLLVFGAEIEDIIKEYSNYLVYNEDYTEVKIRGM